jgi:hypothetical protein
MGIKALTLNPCYSKNHVFLFLYKLVVIYDPIINISLSSVNNNICGNLLPIPHLHQPLPCRISASNPLQTDSCNAVDQHHLSMSAP